MNRILFDSILFVSLFIFPWWVAGLLAFVGIFSYKYFYEFFITAGIIYALYVVPDLGFMASPLWYSLFISIVFIIIQFSRRYIVLYKNEI